jgi:hypothetical protein
MHRVARWEGYALVEKSGVKGVPGTYAKMQREFQFSLSLSLSVCVCTCTCIETCVYILYAHIHVHIRTEMWPNLTGCVDRRYALWCGEVYGRPACLHPFPRLLTCTLPCHIELSRALHRGKKYKNVECTKTSILLPFTRCYPSSIQSAMRTKDTRSRGNIRPLNVTARKSAFLHL